MVSNPCTRGRCKGVFATELVDFSKEYHIDFILLIKRCMDDWNKKNVTQFLRNSNRFGDFSLWIFSWCEEMARTKFTKNGRAVRRSLRHSDNGVEEVIQQSKKWFNSRRRVEKVVMGLSSPEKAMRKSKAASVSLSSQKNATRKSIVEDKAGNFIRWVAFVIPGEGHEEE